MFEIPTGIHVDIDNVIERNSSGHRHELISITCVEDVHTFVVLTAYQDEDDPTLTLYRTWLIHEDTYGDLEPRHIFGFSAYDSRAGHPFR